MKAFVLINIRTGDLREVIRHLKRIEGVKEVDMTFGPYDAVIVIEAPDLEKIGAILANSIQPIPGVLETLTCLAVNV